MSRNIWGWGRVSLKVILEKKTALPRPTGNESPAHAIIKHQEGKVWFFQTSTDHTGRTQVGNCDKEDLASASFPVIPKERRGLKITELAGLQRGPVASRQADLTSNPSAAARAGLSTRALPLGI